MAKLVTFAVPEEAGPFRRFRLRDVRVFVTGMGAEAARRGIRAAFASGTPDLVITAGFCGGLDPALKRGTVVVDKCSDPSLLEVAERVGIRPAAFHFSDRIAVNADEKARLAEQTGKAVVEMESGVIAETCRERGIPVATIRVISDQSDEDLPLDFNKLMTRRGGVHLGRLAVELARRPGVIRRLMRLRKETRQAAANLAEALLKFCEAWDRGSGLT